MAWDWIGTVVTGAVGITGVGGTAYASRQQSTAAVRLAREERRQRRQESAYVELQRTVDRWATWSMSLFPAIVGAGQEQIPPWPDDEQSKDTSSLQVYWSPEVRQLAQSWALARTALLVIASNARTDAAISGPLYQYALQHSNEFKRSLTDTSDALTAGFRQVIWPRRPSPILAPPECAR